MKQLTCEMCGSTELVKQDGFFVCQTCGTKYSVEEAKKMMIEGTVDVTGSTVKVDRSNEINNRIENIKNEFNNGNNDNVKRMCIELLNIDPNNFQAIMYSALAEGWQSSIGKPQIMKASSELQRAVNVIRELYEDDETYTKLCIEPMQEMRRLAQAMINLYVKHNKEQQAEYERWVKEYKDGTKDLWKYVGSSVYNRASERVEGYRKRAEQVDNDRVETYNNGCASVCRAVNNLAIEIINQIQENADACDRFYDELDNFVKVCKGYLTDDGVVNQYNSIMRFLLAARAECTLKQAKNKAEKREAYWKEHPEEKASSDYSWYSDLAKATEEDLVWFREKMNADTITDSETHLLEKYFTAQHNGNEKEALEIRQNLMMIFFGITESKTASSDSQTTTTKQGSSGGCYIATCVYGSYDCPQVWTLRRYRDDTLGATWHGRLFVRTYYAISPTLVKWFGQTNWFKKLWKGKLDHMVANLQLEGFESTPYKDKKW